MEEFSRIQRLPAVRLQHHRRDEAQAARHRGEDIIDFGMGNPDGATPKHIVDKLVEAALKPPTHRYSVSRGIPRLRKAICTWYKTRYNVDLDPETEAIVTIGSKEGIAHLCLAILDSRDTVLVPNPSYPIHIYGPVIAGAHVVSVPVHDREQFLAELEALIPRMVPRPKALIVNFPSNPTTECVELPFLARLVELAREYGFHLIQDLAYADIAFDGYKPPSVLEVPGAKDVAVEFFTLSKSYNMPGWRVGFMVGNPVLVSALSRLKSYFDYGTFTPIQVASIAALEGPRSAWPRSAKPTAAAATCSSMGSTSWAGRSRCPRPPCSCGRRSRSSTASSARLSFRSSCSTKPRRQSPLASASATTATRTCASRSSRMKSAQDRPCAASSPCLRRGSDS